MLNNFLPMQHTSHETPIYDSVHDKDHKSSKIATQHIFLAEGKACYKRGREKQRKHDDCVDQILFHNHLSLDLIKQTKEKSEQRTRPLLHVSPH